VVTESALQVEYADGTICRGTVTNVSADGFSGECVLSNGERRTVDASFAELTQSHVAGRLRLAA